jgi:outer membrane protein
MLVTNTTFLHKQKPITSMRKLFFTLLVTLASMSAFAQFQQGRMLVGGNVGLELKTNKTKFDGSTDTNGKYTSFSLEPQFGYFVIDNLAVGAGLNLTLSSWKPDGSDGKSTSSLIALSPFARYYFGPGIFGEAKVLLGASKDKDDFGGNTDEKKFNVTGLSLGAGYAIFLNDNVAIEPMIGYETIGYKNKTSGEPDYKDIDSGLFVRVGFQIYLK